MKKLGIIIGLMVGISGCAFADVPSVTIQSGSHTWNVQLTYNSATQEYTAANPNQTYTASSDPTSPAISISSLVLDGDPSISYVVAGSNSPTATGFTPYTFTFNLPVTLFAGQVAVSSSLGITATDGGTNGVIVEPPASGFIQQAFIGGNDIAAADLFDATQSGNLVFPTGTHGVFSDVQPNTTIYNLSADASTISVVTSFSVSDNDQVGVSGNFTVSQVTIAAPEPSCYMLAIIGATIFLMFKRLRRLSKF